MTGGDDRKVLLWNPHRETDVHVRFAFAPVRARVVPSRKRSLTRPDLTMGPETMRKKIRTMKKNRTKKRKKRRDSMRK